MAPTGRLPRLIAFDLDYTLWNLWIDTHITGPLRRNGQKLNEVLDKDDEPISFYDDVPDILHMIRAFKLEDTGDTIKIAACSRTYAPKLADRCLRLLLLPPPSGDGSVPIPAINFFDELEIYPGPKITHFKRLHQKTGIDYTDMLFFDDEHRNSEVEKLGVTFVLVPTMGVTRKVFDEGIERWRKKTEGEP